MKEPVSNALRRLTEVNAGSRVRVSQVEGGRGLRARLCAMGLTPGTPVQVIAVNGGPVILEVLGGRLMLGRQMAGKLLVREVTDEPR